MLAVLVFGLWALTLALAYLLGLTQRRREEPLHHTPIRESDEELVYKEEE